MVGKNLTPDEVVAGFYSTVVTLNDQRLGKKCGRGELRRGAAEVQA